MNNEIALQVEQLSFAYGKKQALKMVNVDVPTGTCCMLLGPNGAGKSTLFALITRLYDTREGAIKLCGYDVKRNHLQALSQLGVVFQQPTLDMDLTVMQNLRYHAALHGIGRMQASQRIQEELERLDMYERRKEQVRKLNGGHKRRVEIARALLHEPRLLLLDEPTVGLDMPSRKAIVEHVHAMAEEKQLAVLWATHLIDEVYDNDHLVVIHRGQVRAAGSVTEVLQTTAAESVQVAYDTLTKEVRA